MVGHKEVAGRPALLATTTEFLNDFGLKSLEELPNAEDLIVSPTADLLDQMDIQVSERLQKVLAMSRLRSRRALEVAIAEGQVSVNGVIAVLGTKIEKGDEVVFNGKPVLIEKLFGQTRLVLLTINPRVKFALPFQKAAPLFLIGYQSFQKAGG